MFRIFIILIVIQLVSAQFFSSLYKNSVCRATECCEVDPELYIINKVPDFHELYGQHVAVLELQRALAVFYKRQDRTKPLVLSFHGTPGTGKNWAAEKIVKARYQYGKESKYVHTYFGRMNFPNDADAAKYSAELRDNILSHVRSCPHQTFIFDEVDKMPPGVFESIVALLDHQTLMKNIDFSKTLFIFLSNLGGVEIGNKLLSLIKDKRYSREQAQLSHFESLIETAAFNSEGGLQKSSSIVKAVIDLFIPFMPLEIGHVQLCIERLIALVTPEPQPMIVKKVLESITYEQDSKMFVASGCKKLEWRVNAYLHSEL